MFNTGSRHAGAGRYRYNVIDMHTVDCQHLLTQDKRS
jgi:hypothetical protein